MHEENTRENEGVVENQSIWLMPNQNRAALNTSPPLSQLSSPLFIDIPENRNISSKVISVNNLDFRFGKIGNYEVFEDHDKCYSKETIQLKCKGVVVSSNDNDLHQDEILEVFDELEYGFNSEYTKQPQIDIVVGREEKKEQKSDSKLIGSNYSWSLSSDTKFKFKDVSKEISCLTTNRVEKEEENESDSTVIGSHYSRSLSFESEIIFKEISFEYDNEDTVTKTTEQIGINDPLPIGWGMEKENDSEPVIERLRKRNVNNHTPSKISFDNDIMLASTPKMKGNKQVTPSPKKKKLFADPENEIQEIYLEHVEDFVKDVDEHVKNIMYIRIQDNEERPKVPKSSIQWGRVQTSKNKTNRYIFALT